MEPKVPSCCPCVMFTLLTNSVKFCRYHFDKNIIITTLSPAVRMYKVLLQQQETVLIIFLLIILHMDLTVGTFINYLNLPTQ